MKQNQLFEAPVSVEASGSKVTTSISEKQMELTVEKGKIFCTSLQVAECFGKENKHVNRDIENIIKEIGTNLGTSKISEYFVLSSYKDGYSRKQKMYLLTKDGFSLLAMGFSGSKAMQFKLAFLKRFNEMEAEIQKAKTEFGFMEDWVQLQDIDFQKEQVKGFHAATQSEFRNPERMQYAKRCNMLYQSLVDMHAKQYKQYCRLTYNSDLKDYESGLAFMRKHEPHKAAGFAFACRAVYKGAKLEEVIESGLPSEITRVTYKINQFMQKYLK